MVGVMDCDAPPPDPELGHALLDVCGQVPGFGEPCDVFNGFLYLTEGEWLDAAISGVGVIPFFGNAATASRLGSKGSKGSACSFSGDTQVLMADGTRKPIKDVQVGDRVLAADPETGEKGARIVTAVLAHEDAVLDLVTEDGAKVTTTEDHPFWNATDRKWQRADQLDPGDALLTATGSPVRVTGLRVGSEHVTTAYNLTVQDLHTYHVATGTGSILVHNDCAPFVEGEIFMHVSHHGERTVESWANVEFRGTTLVLSDIVVMGDGRHALGAGGAGALRQEVETVLGPQAASQGFAEIQIFANRVTGNPGHDVALVYNIQTGRWHRG